VTTPYDRLGHLDKTAVWLTEQLLEYLDTDPVLDALDNAYSVEEPSEWDQMTPEEQDRYTERSSEFQDKVVARACQAVVNLCKGRDDKVAYWSQANHATE
jgi:hypothetical protein